MTAPRNLLDGRPASPAASRRSPRAALTFDDGPSPWTDGVLDALQQYGARATFFVLGCAIEGREEILRRVVGAGCEVGVHGFSHRSLTTMSDREVRDEMARTITLVQAVIGRRPRLWRPPRLEVDTRVRAICAGLRLREVWLTADTLDYMSTSDAVTTRAIAGLKHRAVILLHDGRAPTDGPEESLPSREGTVAALPGILEEANRRGLRMVTASEILRPPLRSISRPAVLWATAKALVRL